MTAQQSEFVLHYTSTPGAIGNAAEAARRAGYSDKSAREIGRQLLDKRHVQEAVFDANRRCISGSLATKAVALLEKVIDDEGAPIKVRVDAAKTVLDRAGFVMAASEAARPQAEKALHEMSREELEAVIRQSQEVLEEARSAGLPN